MNESVLVIGLGSMGKRRVRCLRALGYKDITGFDPREDRRRESRETYDIITSGQFDELINEKHFDAWFISVPPDLHHLYMKAAIAQHTPAFIEASVVDTNMPAIIEAANKQQLLLAPSCTVYFHPAVKTIFELVNSGALGTLSSIMYHSGQYLPDWHTYEPVSSYYVSKRETGGGREIVPFELTWLTQLLGFPQRVAGLYKKTIDIEGAHDIDDTYMLLMDYGKMLVNLTVDVVSRAATRRLTINGSLKQLVWDWDDEAIKLFDPASTTWTRIPYQQNPAQQGYNKNISEGMYIEEVETFLNAAFTGTTWPSSLEHDHKVLQLLYDAEESADKNIFKSVRK